MFPTRPIDSVIKTCIILTVSVKQSVPPLKAGSMLSSFCCSGGMEVCESCDM